jgi:chromosome segregation ATPase
VGDAKVLTTDRLLEELHMLAGRLETDWDAEQARNAILAHDAALRASLAETKQESDKRSDALAGLADAYNKVLQERDALRADVERLRGELRGEQDRHVRDCNAYNDQRNALFARAEKAEGEVSSLALHYAEVLHDARGKQEVAERELQSHLESTDGVRQAVVRAQEEARALRDALVWCVSALDATASLPLSLCSCGHGWQQCNCLGEHVRDACGCCSWREQVIAFEVLLDEGQG